jgi:hypothetical protein
VPLLLLLLYWWMLWQQQLQVLLLLLQALRPQRLCWHHPGLLLQRWGYWR